MSAPTGVHLEAFSASTTRITRRVDIYEADGETIWMRNAPLIDGSISVDQARDERRAIDLLLDNEDGSLKHHPGGFWYDKIIKAYRGIEADVAREVDAGLKPYEEVIYEDRPIGYWRLGETSGTVAYDSSGRDYDGTYAGSPTLGVVGALADDADTAVRFPDAATIVDIGTALNIQTGSFSAEAWVRLETVDGGQRVVVKDDGTSGSWALSAQDGGAGSLRFFIRGASVVVLDSPGSLLAVDTWHHVAGTYDSPTGARRLYVDGSQVASDTINTGGFPTTTAALRLSGNVAAGRALDEPAIYPRALTADEIKRHYDAGKALVRRTETIYEPVMWETQLGEFMVDDIQQPNFPPQVTVRGRDYTKKLLLDKFSSATAFGAGQSIEAVIKNIALNGGIDKFIFPGSTGKTLGIEHLFERGTERWKAMTDIAIAFGYELYFDAQGYLVMAEQQDPTSSPVVFTFLTGDPDGNLASYVKSVNDTRIKNHVVVSGENASQVPIFAEAENNAPDSPTRIAVLGRRTWEYVSAYIDSLAQAQEVADNFLKVMALESFDIRMDSLVVPWLEVGKIVEFIDPDPSPGDPTRFLLSSFDIPLKLGTMPATGKRVTMVG